MTTATKKLSYAGLAGKKKYLLGQQLAKGGEGIVYEVDGDSTLVAKIYKPDRFVDESEKKTMERKLKAMLAMKVDAVVDGKLRLAWPQDILYENGSIVGFVMPRLRSDYKIYDVYRTGKDSIREREEKYRGVYTWKYSAQFAYNMAWVVNYVHSKGIVIGDLNQNNLVVDPETSTVILIDCDSFDIRDPDTGEHFPCVVGLEEMLAPELQTVVSLKKGQFTKESDNFSLAIHIFRMLMNNEDPFGGAITTNASQSAIAGNTAIIKGECLYVRDVPGKKWLQRMPKLEILPPAIQQLFRKTFDYTELTVQSKKKNRATAKEWVDALAVIGAPEPNPHLKHCSVNSQHVYPVHNAACPWCAIDKALSQPTVPNPSVKHTSTSTTRTTLPSGTHTTIYTPPLNSSTSSTSSGTSRIRRSATLFYVVLMLFGMASGFIFGEWICDTVNSFFDIGMPYEAAIGVISVLGLISGGLLAHYFEDSYTHANNGLVWLLMGFVAAIIPLAIALVLGIVAAIVVAVVQLVISVLAIIFICAMCAGS